MKTSAAILLAAVGSLCFACKDARRADTHEDDATVAPLGTREKPPATKKPPATNEPLATDEPPAADEPLSAEAETPVLAMQKHFAHALTAKDTILFGDLDVAMASLRWLAENGASDEQRESWEPHIGRVRRIAQDSLSSKKV